MNDADRFWAKVDTTAGPRGCWLWTAATNQYGYAMFWCSGRVRSASRILMEIVTGEPLGKLEVDHQHTCPKNCVNPMHLRLVTSQQNHENFNGAQSNSKSGVRGVYWNKQKRCWTAQAATNGRSIHIGNFNTLEEANEAARLKRLELHTHNDADRVS